MVVRLLIVAAAVVSIATAGLHVWGGGPEFYVPALESSLPDIWKAAFSTIWHQVTTFLLLNGGFLIVAARSTAINRALLALVAAQNAAFGVLFVAYGWGRLGSPLCCRNGYSFSRLQG
jgi:hypothetical protein